MLKLWQFSLHIHVSYQFHPAEQVLRPWPLLLEIQVDLVFRKPYLGKKWEKVTLYDEGCFKDFFRLKGRQAL